MHEHRISSFEDLHAVLARYRNGRWLFRGQSDCNWPLVPKVGRAPYRGVDEREHFENWKRYAVELMATTPVDDWDWLAVAQHYGFATRLLDWTTNPLAAVYFAVSEDLHEDAAVYAYYPRWVVRREKVGPFDRDGVVVFRPPAVARRISQQSGVFTLHGPADFELEHDLDGCTLEKLVIERGYRRDLRIDLDYYGVNTRTLFPDLDGLSRYGNWAMANREVWTRRDLDDSASEESPSDTDAG